MPMRSMPDRLRARVATTCLAVTLAAGSCASAAVRTWPGAAPCDTTLFACVQAAADGDIVEVASNGPIAENIFIEGKSLVLRPAAGFAPVFEGAPSLNVINAYGADVPVAITIEGLTVRGGSVHASQRGSGAFGVTIRGMRVEDEDLDANRTGIRISTFGPTPTGPVNFAIVDNTIDIGFLEGDDIVAIGVDDLPGATIGTIQGNTIGAGGAGSTRGAIVLRNGSGTARFDVGRNRIVAPGYNGGLFVEQDGGGVLEARIVGNLVTGTIAVTGPQPAAIALRASAGTLHADVLGNTLVDNAIGFVAHAAAGATLDGVLANTIVARSEAQGIVIGPGLAGFANRHNLESGNGSNDFVPGPGTVHADPAFAGAADFRLRADSPARDAGDTALASGIAVDLDGSPRVFGAAVDIGAWEIGDPIFSDSFEA